MFLLVSRIEVMSPSMMMVKKLVVVAPPNARSSRCNVRFVPLNLTLIVVPGQAKTGAVGVVKSNRPIY